MISVYGVSGIAAALGGIPVIGWLVGAYGGVIVVRSAEQIASGLVKEAVYGRGMDVSVGFSWFTPYLSCSARTK